MNLKWGPGLAKNRTLDLREPKNITPHQLTIMLTHDICFRCPLLRALTQPASSLHSFHINNLARPDQDDLDDDEFNSKLFILPDNLFAGDAPCLREFAITNAFLRPSFDFSVWEQLTELFVDQALGGLQGNKILSRQWLDILRQMKQLEYLGLVWAYNVAFDEALHLLPEELEPDHNITNMADVHLEHLHTLWLMASSERNIMLDIFSKLVVPDTCFASITVTHNPREDLRFDRLSTGLNHRAMGWRAAHIPFHIRLLQGARQFGFQIELYNKSTDLEDYAFRFHFLGSGIEEDLPEDADAIPQSVDETSPFSRVMEVLKNAFLTLNSASAPVSITELRKTGDPQLAMVDKRLRFHLPKIVPINQLFRPVTNPASPSSASRAALGGSTRSTSITAFAYFCASARVCWTPCEVWATARACVHVGSSIVGCFLAGGARVG
ncbi:hypothetical protein BJ912DRAFT_1125298 [Pholiota molesta]|nr:hypothetical protein BJ912DRAFT_1125298 [Pholiota molesta]